jgi:hypothetical protein
MAIRYPLISAFARVCHSSGETAETLLIILSSGTQPSKKMAIGWTGPLTD